MFHDKGHPEEMGGAEISEFLTHLAVDRKVSAPTQNQALNAIVFLFKRVLKKHPGEFDFRHARVGKRLPVVFSRDEVQDVLSNLLGEFHLMASLLYGSGLRLTECMQLRIKDIDFDLNEIIVRGGKGDHDRRTLLPQSLIPGLKRQIVNAGIRPEENLLLEGFAGASMPEALERKYPGASKELSWQYIFPSRKPCTKSPE